MTKQQQSKFIWWHFLWLIPGVLWLSYEFLQAVPRAKLTHILSPSLPSFAGEPEESKQMEPYFSWEPSQKVVRFSSNQADKLFIQGEAGPQIWNIKTKKVEVEEHNIKCAHFSSDGNQILR